jgi:hypothetical protein
MVNYKKGENMQYIMSEDELKERLEDAKAIGVTLTLNLYNRIKSGNEIDISNYSDENVVKFINELKSVYPVVSKSKESASVSQNASSDDANA